MQQTNTDSLMIPLGRVKQMLASLEAQESLWAQSDSDYGSGRRAGLAEGAAMLWLCVNGAEMDAETPGEEVA